MQTEIIASPKGELSLCRLEADERVVRPSDFLEILGNTGATTIVLRKEDFDESFFDLRSGLAGDCLQKVSTYRRRLAILGDHQGFASKALRDFIYESNKTGKVVFASDLEGAIALLR